MSLADTKIIKLQQGRVRQGIRKTERIFRHLNLATESPVPKSRSDNPLTSKIQLSSTCRGNIEWGESISWPPDLCSHPIFIPMIEEIVLKESLATMNLRNALFL